MKRAAVILIILGIVGLAGWWFYREFEIVSPLGVKKEVKEENRMSVIGFLPTWMVGKTIDYSDEIDSLIFLGVEMDGEGNLIWDLQSKKINNENYVKLKNRVSKNILGIKLFKDGEIDKLLASEEAKRKAVEEIKAIVEVADYDGVNIDFEYMNDPMRLLEDDFVNWLEQLRNFGVGEISMDVFANTVIKGDVVKIKRVMDKLDYLVVMGYDFHRPSSDFAGAVAPIGSKAGERNLGEVVQKVAEADIDEKKVIMALPLYGYEWQVEGEEANGRTIGLGWMVSYREGMEKYDKDSKWDELTMSPWISTSEVVTKTRNKRVLVNKKWRTVKEQYQETVHYQAYFENERSLGAKMDLVVESGFGGVGFWALGYEGDNSNVWKIVGEKIESGI